MNISFEYLYREAGNFKNWGEIIFSNKNNYDVIYLVKQVRGVLIDQEFFIANKADVPILLCFRIVYKCDNGPDKLENIIGAPAPGQLKRTD